MAILPPIMAGGVSAHQQEWIHSHTFGSSILSFRARSLTLVENTFGNGFRSWKGYKETQYTIHMQEERAMKRKGKDTRRELWTTRKVEIVLWRDTSRDSDEMRRERVDLKLFRELLATNLYHLSITEACLS